MRAAAESVDAAGHLLPFGIPLPVDVIAPSFYSIGHIGRRFVRISAQNITFF
jgi:hypothetical protein